LGLDALGGLRGVNGLMIATAGVILTVTAVIKLLL
jgi:hypothetical protein